MNILRAVQEADSRIIDEYQAVIEPRQKLRGGIEWRATITREGSEVMASEWGTLNEAVMASEQMLSQINRELLDAALERLNQEHPEHVYPEPSDTFCDGVKS